MALSVDTILENRYRIDRLLSHGGMGAIYQGFDTNLNMPVAIKENFFQTPQSIIQFKQEALILARLHHPSLPRVIHHFSFEGQQYLVMDYIEGEDLWSLVKEQGHPLEEAQAIDYTIQVADAAYYLHTRNPPIIHRDIKPQNIKITPDNRAVLVDFGIAKIVDDKDGRTRTGAQAVTPGFSPPEQYSGAGTTAVSDVYSLGATLYAILTGKKPPDSISVIVGQAKFKAPHLLNTALTTDISEAILSAMQSQVEDRPASMAAWKKELQTILTSLSSANSGDPDTLITGPKTQFETAPTTTHWLVDSKGVGYPLGLKPIVIGRHSQADIPLTVLSVSRQHAFVQLDRGQCLVNDNASANGTFINQQRLAPGWQPMNPGDTLNVGSAQFSLTISRPPKVATINPKNSILITDDKRGTTGTLVGPPPPFPPVQSTPTQSTPAQSTPVQSNVGTLAGSSSYVAAHAKKKRSPLIPIIISGIILLLGLAMAGYFIIGSVTDTSTSTTATTRAAALNQSATAEAEVITLQNNKTATAVAEETDITSANDIIPTSTNNSEATPTTESNITPLAAAADTATPTPTEAPATLAKVATATPTATTSSQTPTATPLPQTATATPRPIVSGPTLIAVKTVESISQIGENVPVIAIQINPQNPQEVYALAKGELNALLKSSTGGGGPWGKLEIDASGLTNFMIDPGNPTRLYAPAWNAVIVSDDGGNSWKAFGDGLSSANRVVDLITIDPLNPNVIYGGIGTTFVVSTDGGASWSSDGFGNGLGQGKLTSIVVNPFDPNMVFVGGEFGSLYKSVNSGRDFDQLFFNTGRGAYGMAAHPEKEGEFLVGINSYEAAIMKTTNAADFQSSSNGLVFGGADSAYSAITYAPGNPNIVYVGSGYENDGAAKGIFKSTDGGKSWNQINNGLRINPTTGQPHYVKSIAVHPTNPNIVFAATGWGLYKSQDGGANWILQ